MSGGALTDHTYDLYRLSEWADALDASSAYSNTALSQIMRDLEGLLEVVDRVMSGDASEERADEAWRVFRDRWLTSFAQTSTDLYEARIRALADEAVRLMSQRGSE